jgi:outer membrane protein assembly factor BamA
MPIKRFVITIRIFGNMLLRVYLFWACCCFSSALWGQVPQVVIQSIDIEGLRQTKASLVYNELDFKEGDTLLLQDLMPRLEQNRRYLINTLLFRKVVVNVGAWKGAAVGIKITVQENWYIFPIPQFELADRNFNVWWTRHQRDLRRTNGGLWFIWRNISGYNDLLKAIVQFGYTRKFELEYNLPPMGRARKFGFHVNALYSDNKEVAYQTINNKLVFYNNYDSQERQYQRIRGRLVGYYRPSLQQLHRLEFSFLHLRIHPNVLTLNADFFQTNQVLQRSFALQYSYSIDKRDIQTYPLQGYFIRASLGKQGLGIFKEVDLWQGQLNAAYYHSVDKHFSIALRARGQLTWSADQLTYYNNRALGFYENYVRGYQYYVIDGQAFALFQGDLNWKLLEFSIPLFKKAPSGYLSSLPIRLHFRYHLDYGYVWDRYYSYNNPLSNTHLVGSGFGLDFVFYAYNIIVQFEYTFNKSGEKGLYLRYKFNF